MNGPELAQRVNEATVAVDRCAAVDAVVTVDAVCAVVFVLAAAAVIHVKWLAIQKKSFERWQYLQRGFAFVQILYGAVGKTIVAA